MTAPTAEQVRALARGPRDQAWQGSLRALAIEDVDVFQAGVEVLRGLAPLPELDEAFERDPHVALTVASALADATYRARMEALLDHDHGSVRAQAARALALMPDVCASALLGALTDSSTWVRAAAVHSLGRIGTPDALAALQRLALHEQNSVVRTALVDVLHPRGLWR